MRRPANDRQTYGFARFETIAALVNGFLLFGITAVVVVEAVRRFWAPELPQGGAMAAFAGIGLAVNVAIGLLLLRGAHGDLNVRAALLHVGGDALGAFSVAAGGLLVLATHAAWIDPAVSLFVAAIIVARRHSDRTRSGIGLARIGTRASCGAARARAVYGRSPAWSTFTICTCGRSAAVRTCSPRTSNSKTNASVRRRASCARSSNARAKNSASTT